MARPAGLVALAAALCWAAVGARASASDATDASDNDLSGPSSATASPLVSLERLVVRLVQYPMDVAALAFVLLFLAVYLVGRLQNSGRASAFAAAHRRLLLEQFQTFASPGGPTGPKPDPGTGFVKESDTEYTMWATGRRNVKGALVTLQLKPRQDLFTTLAGFIQPSISSDRVVIEVPFDDSRAPACILAIVPVREKKALKEGLEPLLRAGVQFPVDKRLAALGGGEGSSAAAASGSAGASASSSAHAFDVVSEHSSLVQDLLGDAGVALLAANRQLLRGLFLTDLPDMADFRTAALNSPRTLRVVLALPSRPKDLAPLLTGLFALVDRIAAAGPLRKEAQRAVDENRDRLAADLRRRQLAAQRADPKELERRRKEEEEAEARRRERLSRMTPEERARELERERKEGIDAQVKRMRKRKGMMMQMMK